jgi:hypothetical protein
VKRGADGRGRRTLGVETGVLRRGAARCGSGGGGAARRRFGGGGAPRYGLGGGDATGIDAGRAASDALTLTPRHPLPRVRERLAGAEYRGEWGLARRGGKEGDEGDDGSESDLGEERSASRMPVQGDGRQRLGSGDAIPFPSLNERFPVDHVAVAGGVCWKRGAGRAHDGGVIPPRPATTENIYSRGRWQCRERR